MGKEIERKFLIKSDEWRKTSTCKSYRQGYLSSVKERTVRIRTAGGEGFITIKGESAGASRSEYEYKIPLAEAEEILSDLCEKPLIEKNRYKIRRGKFIWEIDEFLGDNSGLTIAEIELENENEEFEKPEWLGEEVTNDSKYFNSSLVKNPYSKWNKK